MKIMKEKKMMQKIFKLSDLKTGMSVKFRDGSMGIVVGDKIMLEDSYMPLSYYENELHVCEYCDDSCDIVAVFNNAVTISDALNCISVDVVYEEYCLSNKVYEIENIEIRPVCDTYFSTDADKDILRIGKKPFGCVYLNLDEVKVAYEALGEIISTIERGQE